LIYDDFFGKKNRQNIIVMMTFKPHSVNKLVWEYNGLRSNAFLHCNFCGMNVKRKIGILKERCTAFFLMGLIPKCPLTGKMKMLYIFHNYN
jgi:hypothetical protein